jgi:isoleucyl-tRNA synthetase
MDIKDTLNLPRTSFPMKANLQVEEPKRLARWEAERLYERMLEARKDAPLYVLHDGPPYANGQIHIGHALNKILKDIIVRSKFLEGFRTPYIPGWDCHGLPIEHQVDKNLGPKKAGMSKIEIRRLCREYAEKYVEIQREEFKRLGVTGDWSRPYLTMDHAYEAAIVREFGRFVAAGSVYRGKKPVHWCPSCETALAEAEVEYADHESPSVYVKFPVKTIPDRLKYLFPEFPRHDAYVVIWTTTPWTLPANLAIAAHRDFSYEVVMVNAPRTGLEQYVLAASLVESCMEKFGFRKDPKYSGSGRHLPSQGHYVPCGALSGRELEGVVCRHPFYERDSPVVLADYVTLDAGTGLVHTAPGHGQEDYATGIKYGLDVYAPVDGKGRFTPDVAEWAGVSVFKANPAIVEKLRGADRLLAEEKLAHSYPHCWRCKRPVIFRATEQWFVSMETNRLKERAIEGIHNVRWIPQWGKDRILGMMTNRPDWCLSRQRAWGVPIAAFRCGACGHVLIDGKVVDHVADLVAREGADVWFSREAEDLVPPGTTCPACGQAAWEREEDILDVWFDSGVSHAAVLESRDDLAWPADLYLEGSDQHRGWFQSSLLAAVGTRGKPPFKGVLTHGFVVDGQGKKMSKSAGNVVAPQEVIKQHGAEILRLWVAAEDYRDDVRISSEIITRQAEAYRRIRNTARYLLSNLYDYVPGRDGVPDGVLVEIDRWIVDRMNRLEDRVRRAYDDFEFHAAFHSIHNFCVVDLSALYLDIAKDRLYCEAAAGAKRRAAQTAVYRILRRLTLLIAPLLPLTAEEIWEAMPREDGDPDTVHLSRFPGRATEFDDALAERWDRLIKVRGEAAKVLEAARAEKKIGASLEAEVILAADGETGAFLRGVEDLLPDLFIVSSVRFAEAGERQGLTVSPLIPELAVGVERAKGSKCVRCWKYDEAVGRETSHPGLCPRCAGVVAMAEK